MPRLAVLALLLTTLAACDAGEPANSESDGLSGDVSLLAGSWAWERSVTCGRAGGCLETTPASTGRAETLAFTYTPETSSHNGTVAGFFNGRDVAATTYLVEPSSQTLALGGGGSAWFGVSEDRLVISTAASDGEETTYRRR